MEYFIFQQMRQFLRDTRSNVSEQSCVESCYRQPIAVLYCANPVSYHPVHPGDRVQTIGPLCRTLEVNQLELCDYDIHGQTGHTLDGHDHCIIRIPILPLIDQ
ncbi:hypothetical protein K1T71_009257 [Dendrolimus kikuchii]|uniref:Uncharacterized protein n=1 Tax=Dendrolimus kikuchii TaxID=765133 RepID=A0ACC1CU77_9NEOP|nr:hypothetical protein K1T71_009257 [Dendrolimus kikuchii]